MNPFTDKYFTRSKQVAEKMGMNPLVKYRVFMRDGGVAALKPMAELIKNFAPNATVQFLSTGTPFNARDTAVIISGRFQDLVELETMYLNWTALPCFCAEKTRKIVRIAKDKMILDFAARHLFDPTSIALASYGAMVGGIPAASTDVGANSLNYLRNVMDNYSTLNDVCEVNNVYNHLFPKSGIGTTPHALIAIFRGDYEAMGQAYIDTFPGEGFVSLIDYNNREVDDALKQLKKFNKKLAGVRTDTCGENYAQIGYKQDGSFEYAEEKGVVVSAVEGLRNALDHEGGEHVKIFVSSGFDFEKTAEFMERCPRAFSGIGTGSFIPKVPTATSDIFEVNGERECKVGREWGYKANKEFFQKEISEM